MSLIILTSSFITLLLVANVIAVKLVTFGPWIVPAAVIAYPFSFLITDVIGEIYGKQTASRIVWIGFGANMLMLLLLYIGKIIPPAPVWTGQPAYEIILGSVHRVVLGSMFAYLVSQHHDVITFHAIRKLTKGKHLWLRNNVSTMISQAIDTVIFISIAYAGIVSGSVLVQMMIGQYVIKVIVAIIDTPLCYGLVWLFRKHPILSSSIQG